MTRKHKASQSFTEFWEKALNEDAQTPEYKQRQEELRLRRYLRQPLNKTIEGLLNVPPKPKADDHE